MEATERREDPLDRRAHRKIGAHLFNYTWELLDRKLRTVEESDELLHAAHASRYHWGHAGGPLNRSIGEWQISRVYAVLGRPEGAAYHGGRALAIARRYRLSSFYVAYAYEALARASALAGDRAARQRYLRQAERFGKKVHDADDRRMLFEDLATLPRGASRRRAKRRPLRPKAAGAAREALPGPTDARPRRARAVGPAALGKEAPGRRGR